MSCTAFWHDGLIEYAVLAALSRVDSLPCFVPHGYQGHLPLSALQIFCNRTAQSEFANRSLYVLYQITTTTTITEAGERFLPAPPSSRRPW